MTTDNCEVPITELLRGVPINHRLEIEINSTHHRMIPVGVHCHNAAAELEALQKEVEVLRQQVAFPIFTKRVVEERNSLRTQNRELREALSVAINTVECDSLDKDGNELPWYKMAKSALAKTEVEK